MLSFRSKKTKKVWLTFFFFFFSISILVLSQIIDLRAKLRSNIFTSDSLPDKTVFASLLNALLDPYRKKVSTNFLEHANSIQTRKAEILRKNKKSQKSYVRTRRHVSFTGSWAHSKKNVNTEKSKQNCYVAKFERNQRKLNIWIQFFLEILHVN